MRKSYLLVVSFVAFLGTAFGQTDDAFSKNFNPIRAELEEWDPIRGPWLSQSLEAMSKQEPIPDRTFPEDITPGQMVAALPENTRASIETIAMRNTTGSETEQAQWNEIRRTVVRPGAGCARRTARTYGDPHLVTFDGARYSFQTVGEYVLAKSTSGFEVQARQKASGDDFSLNSAIAMNVSGDRVGIYSSDIPDGDQSTPVRVNGQAVHIPSNKAYFLKNGGTIRRTGNTYEVLWPTGELVQTSFTGRFMNDVSVQITDCSQGIFSGLLGNANGFANDDFRGMEGRPDLGSPFDGGILGDVSVEMERSRLAFLANQLGDEFRVTPITTLFDYGIGQSTLTFTDRSFPRVHRTINELPQDRRDAARRNCNQLGVSDLDMNGCIYDNVYLDLDPVPTPVVRDPSQGIVLEPIRERKPNVNEPIGAVGKDKEIPNKPRLTPLPIEQSTEKPPMRERVFNREPVEEVEPERTPAPERTTPERTSEPVRTTPVPERTSEPVRTSPAPVRTNPTPEPVRTTPAPAPVRTNPAPAPAPVRTNPAPAPVRTTPPPAPVRSTPTPPPSRTVPSRGGGL